MDISVRDGCNVALNSPIRVKIDCNLPISIIISFKNDILLNIIFGSATDKVEVDKH